MITKVSNNENAESGLLPYPVIIAATKGDPEAMAIVVKHYESYIASLSMRKLYDERGNVYWGIHDMFFVCFCASHRKILLSPTWGVTWFIVTFIIQRGNNIEAVAP